MERTVVIAGSPDLMERTFEGHATVAIDVIRATTTAITAVAQGRRCFPVPTVAAAWDLAARLHDPLLAGEQRGLTPEGFEITNSPAEVAARDDIERPMVLLSSSGTRLACSLEKSAAVHLACFRNYRAVIERLAAQDLPVAVIGAFTNGEFREEDQMCCAWIAEGLIASGFRADDLHTRSLVKRWSNAPRTAFIASKSVAYLLRSGQKRDLDFVLAHFDDLDAVFELRNGEIVASSVASERARAVEQGLMVSG